MLSEQLCEDSLILHNALHGEKCSLLRQASTATPSESSNARPRPRWADMDSDDDDSMIRPSSLPTAAPCELLGRMNKPRWADLYSDNGEDAENAPKQVHVNERQRSGTPERSENGKQRQPIAPLVTEGQKERGTGENGEGEICTERGTRKSTTSREFRQSDQKNMKFAPKPLVASGHGRGVRARGRNDHPEGAKLQCQFIVGIEEDKKFGVVRKVLGSKGANMKRIALEAGVKLRLRGRGSKFLEGPEQQESSDPLMLCLSAPSVVAYGAAVAAVEELLNNVYADYRDFCAQAGLRRPEVRVQLHEGARDGARQK